MVQSSQNRFRNRQLQRYHMASIEERSLIRIDHHFCSLIKQQAKMLARFKFKNGNRHRNFYGRHKTVFITYLQIHYIFISQQRVAKQFESSMCKIQRKMTRYVMDFYRYCEAHEYLLQSHDNILMFMQIQKIIELCGLVVVMSETLEREVFRMRLYEYLHDINNTPVHIN
jgi:hypothetical protein